MAQLIDSLKAKLKQTLDSVNDDQGWYRKGQFTPIKQVGSIVANTKLRQDGPTIGEATKQVLSQGLNKAFNPFAKMAEDKNNNSFIRTGSDVVNQGLKNFLAGSTFNLVQPKMGEAQTTAGKVVGGATNLIGAFSSPASKLVFGLPEKLATGATRKILLSKAPQLAGSTVAKILPGVTSEAAQTLSYAGLSKFGNKLGLNDQTDQFSPKGLTNSFAMGLGFRSAPNLVQNLFKMKTNGSMHSEDVTWLDTAIDTLRNKKSSPKAISNAKTVIFRLGEKYLKGSEQPESGSPSLIARRLQKVAGDTVGTGLEPSMGIVGSGKGKNVVSGASGEVSQAKKPTIKITKAGENTPQAAIKISTAQKQSGALPSSVIPQQPQPLLQPGQKLRTSTPSFEQPYNNIIAEAKKDIGKVSEPTPKTASQTASDIYGQWVDRFNPITKDANEAKRQLKLKGAELRPEFDPTYQVRRLTGAGGIADYRFRTELEPVIKEMDGLKIDKGDMDVYLANKRMAGFGKAGREVFGADPVKSGQVVNALETKYGENIKGIADKLYKYQDDGFGEMVKAGFISPETAKVIRGQNPDYAPLQRVMDEVDNYLGVPTRKTMQGSQPVIKLKGSKRQIESPLENIIANTFKQRAAIEKNNVARSIAGLQQVADLGYTKVAEAGNETITVWNNGQKEYWQVGEGIANVAKGLNEENMNTLLKIFTVPASILRQGATGRNPEFMIPNIIRDQLDAGITSKYGYIPVIDYLSGLKSMVSNDEIFRKWESSGAKIDLGEMAGRRNISAYFDEKTAKKGLFGWLGAGLDVMGKYSEVPTRVGLFKKAYQKTGNETLAMMESRDATVDFARMGSKMKVANSIVPFLNVGVQGFDKLIRSVKDHPGKVLLNATAYGALPAITTTLYNLANYPEEYAEIPQFEKDSNFVLVKGRNESGTVDYVTIPKGNVLPVIANPIQSFLEYVAGTSQQTLGQFATQFISSTLPVVGDGQSLKEVAIKTIGSNLPQMVKPITENLINKSFYKYDTNKEETKEIVPYYLKDKEPYKQAYKFTPSMYKGIGAVLNVSPLQVQNFMEGYLAGYSKIPAQVVEIAKNMSEGKEVETNQKTILRRFIKETYPTSGKPASQAEPKTTPFMERITGKAKAAGKNENVIAYSKDGKDYELDLSKEFKTPKFGSSDPFDKEAVSRYKTDLSNQVNRIYDAYSDGKLTEEQARAEIVKLQTMYDQSKAKKSKKVSPGKPIKLKPTQVKTPQRIQFSKISMPTPKRKSFSLPKKQKPKVKIKKLPKVTLKSLNNL